MSELARTPLYDWHVEHDGRLVDFAGWSMPVLYSSIVDEHLATRGGAALFDISHMGRLRFDGAGAAAFLDRLLTRPVLSMKTGAIRYALAANEHGGIRDDVLVYRLEDDRGPFHLLVVNAGNRTKIVDWIAQQRTGDDDITMRDLTAETAMIAVQGPRAIETAQPLVEAVLGSLDYYRGAATAIRGNGIADGVAGLVSRTGYTGEDGCELIVPREAATALWKALLESGRQHGARAAGLGARDTLRLEAGMPLYGHELNEEINPFQAGLGFAVRLAGREFVGKEALVALKQDEDLPLRIGLQLNGKRAPREGYAVLRDGQRVGHVTSGTYSPTLERSIAMAYVAPAAASADTLEIDIRGRATPAEVVSLPFYTRSSG